MSLASWVALIANLLLAVLAFVLTVNEKLIKKHRRRLWGWFVVLAVASTIGTVRQSVESERELADSRKQVLSTATGGDSFCYLLPLIAGNSIVNSSYVHRGAYPLYDVQARIVQFRPDGTDPSTRTIENPFGQDLIMRLGEVASGHASLHPMTIQLQGDFVAWNIFYLARNGSWDQLLRLRRIGDKWLFATKVLFRNGNEQKEVFTNIQDGYPPPVNWTESK